MLCSSHAVQDGGGGLVNRGMRVPAESRRVVFVVAWSVRPAVRFPLRLWCLLVFGLVCSHSCGDSVRNTRGWSLIGDGSGGMVSGLCGGHVFQGRVTESNNVVKQVVNIERCQRWVGPCMLNPALSKV